jgi:hypothetical protein
MGYLLSALSPAAAACPAVPALSYMPWDVGWPAMALWALAVAAGIACVGVIGGRLRWTADDPAPLRALWIVLIVVGFGASGAGLYVALANQAHNRAIRAWLAQVSQECMQSAARSPNLIANTATLSVRLGVVALALIVLGASGALLEWRRGKPRAQ